MKIYDVQKRLQEEQVDGWLLYDFQKRNALAIDFLQIPESQHLTRRLFYWIPAKGDPVKIVHATESHVLESLPGRTLVYFRWQILEEHLKSILEGSTRIAMEYSPRNAIPYVSYVDGGILDLVREFVPKVVSSSGFLQHYSCVWTEEQRALHLESAEVLDKTASMLWERLRELLVKGIKVTEYDVQQWILAEFASHGCISEGDPICAVADHSSLPHYCPSREKHREICKGDFVLIDLWCKKKKSNAVYADISRVAIADTQPTTLQKEVFSLVRRAQKEATALVQERCRGSLPLYGYEVDIAARKVIDEAGFGEFFIHRTGHNIHTSDHGPGTHMDSIETWDERPILPRTCFSIEPGIYLPQQFGVRLEYDLFITEKNQVEISGGIQDEIVSLL